MIVLNCGIWVLQSIVVVVFVVSEAERVAANERLCPGQLVESASVIRNIVIVNVREGWLTVPELVRDLAVVWIDSSQLQVPLLLRIILIAFTFSLNVFRLLDPFFVRFGELLVLLLLGLAFVVAVHKVSSPVIEVDVLNDVELFLVEHVLEDLAVILLEVVE